MQFLVALKLHTPPNNSMDYMELSWFYDRYIALQKEEIQQTQEEH